MSVPSTDYNLIRIIKESNLAEGTSAETTAFTTGRNSQGPLMIIHEFMHWMGIYTKDAIENPPSVELPNGQTVTGSYQISEAVRKNCF